MVKLTNTAAACDRSGVKIVMFGKPKVGKTSLIKTAPAPIIFSSERGLLPLRNEKIPVVTIETYKDLEDAFAWVASSAEAKNYKTICWDSVSDTSEAILASERKDNKNKKDNWGPFNILAENMTAKLRDARNMEGRNWYLVCQEEIVAMPEGGKMAVPSLPGKALLQNLPYLFDGILQLVLYVDPATGAQHRAIKTQGDNITMGGDRSSNLNAWEEPNLTNIFAKMLA
jgi:hypothetical protein